MKGVARSLAADSGPVYHAARRLTIGRGPQRPAAAEHRRFSRQGFLFPV